MNNPFDYIPDAECERAFNELTERLDALKGSKRPHDIIFCRELEAGKMLGVLIGEDTSGIRHTLYAFSGQVGDRGFYFPGFVGPVFDYLQPDGYFKTREREISLQNIRIKEFEESILAQIRKDYTTAKTRYDAEISKYKEFIRQSKLERQAKREAGITDEVALAGMIRQSQFEKAELHRIKRRLKAGLEPYEEKLAEAEARLDSMKKKRHADSESLQTWLFNNFRVLNAHGESKSLSEIFSVTSTKIPPSGAGECCAPKLLQAAYLQGLQPLAMAEYWYGNPKGGEVRRHGESYPACRSKCLPLLTWMLQGLDIEPPLAGTPGPHYKEDPQVLYENRWFCIVSKPSGMLSVPGKIKALSMQEWLEKKFGTDRQVKPVHRLDQDTSGLMIAAFGPESYKIIQSLFATRKIKKKYVADLEGDYKSYGLSRHGHIELPLSPDVADRPRQRVDLKNGKDALTDYEFTETNGNRSRIIFEPLTGRTHQLRVHAASEMGLGMPICGDRLYGKKGNDGSGRLLLHALRLEFTFPLDGNHYCFETDIPF